MEKISREFNLGIAREKAFQKFLNELNAWWPKEYTWSQDKLKEIRIDGQKDGLCTEIGPNGFRCDWGRVTELADNIRIKWKWQKGAYKRSGAVQFFTPDGKGRLRAEIIERYYITNYFTRASFGMRRNLPFK